MRAAAPSRRARATIASWREGIPARLVRWRHPAPGADPEEWAEELAAQIGWAGPATIYVLDEPVVSPPIVLPLKAGQAMTAGEAGALYGVAAHGPCLKGLFDAHGCVSVANLSQGIGCYLAATAVEIGR